MNLSLMLGEAIGTLVFLLLILAVLFRRKAFPDHFVPLAIGIGLVVAIILASGLNGSGHLNPIVTLVMGLNGQLAAPEVMEHVIAQVAGGVGALAIFRQLA